MITIQVEIQNPDTAQKFLQFLNQYSEDQLKINFIKTIESDDYDDIQKIQDRKDTPKSKYISLEEMAKKFDIDFSKLEDDK